MNAMTSDGKTRYNYDPPMGHREERGVQILSPIRLDPEDFHALREICVEENIVMAQLLRAMMKFGIEEWRRGR